MGQENPGDDPYEILGVAAGASRQEIVRAYHRAAQGTHPDAKPADPDAAARFRALTAAYELLSDPRRRAAHDRRRAAPAHSAASRTPARSAGPGRSPGSGRSPGPGPSASPAGAPDPATTAHAHHQQGSPAAVRLTLPWPAPPLWAGPVRVDPPRDRPGVAGLAPRWAEDLAGAPGLAALYSGYIWSLWP